MPHFLSASGTVRTFELQLLAQWAPRAVLFLLTLVARTFQPCAKCAHTLQHCMLRTIFMQNVCAHGRCYCGACSLLRGAPRPYTLCAMTRIFRTRTIMKCAWGCSLHWMRAMNKFEMYRGSCLARRLRGISSTPCAGAFVVTTPHASHAWRSTRHSLAARAWKHKPSVHAVRWTCCAHQQDTATM